VIAADQSCDWLKPRKASSTLTGMGFTTTHTNRGSIVAIKPKRLKSLQRRYGTITQSSAKSSPDW
jgi:hypothetical protein